ncbi:MAG: hypothetical protein LLF78_00180 [Synergistaceae bacterium]|nr:hypothetical protein [Synergistaceae bacterium]
MTKVSLSNPELFKIFDEATGEVHLGSSQKWYGTEQQRRAGCGPSVASDLVSYMLLSRSDPYAKGKYISKKDFLVLMEEMWQYVTPSERGLPSTDLFYKYLLSYAKDKGLCVSRCAICDMHSPASSWPSLAEIIRFLEVGLRMDLPVAFLNLDSGEEENLDVWHWVTVIKLEYEGEQAFIDIIDDGAVSHINLTLWYKTTKLGGGFVCFDIKKRHI